MNNEASENTQLIIDLFGEDISKLSEEEKRARFTEELYRLPLEKFVPAFEVISPPKRLLRIPTGWMIRKNSFRELEPDAEPKHKAYPHDDGWGLFEDELLVLDYKFFENIVLDMGWFPNMSAEGMFYLRLIKDSDWENREIICETRSLQEITEAINNEMLRISVENGDYPNGLNGQKLQYLRPFGGWQFVKNEFFDLAPSQNLTTEEWKLLHSNLLRLEKKYYKSKFILTMGWFPAHELNGEYIAKLNDENYSSESLREFKTKNKAEMVEFLNQMIAEVEDIKLPRKK